MNKLEKAKWLSEFYSEYAKGGKEMVCSKSRQRNDWPDMDSVPTNWELRDKQKTPVDLSVLITSGIDCDFSHDIDVGEMIGKLGDIGEWPGGALRYMEKRGGGYKERWRCRPRMDHWHSWQGGECPLPEGFDIEVLYCSGAGDDEETFGYDWSHDEDRPDTDIIAFRVIGLADGYCWPWECES